jgi:hypothetical protein
VLDMHLHFRPNDGNFEHIEGCGVTQANLLAPAASDANAQAAMVKHPGRYFRFVSANITESVFLNARFDLRKDSILSVKSALPIRVLRCSMSY